MSNCRVKNRQEDAAQRWFGTATKFAAKILRTDFGIVSAEDLALELYGLWLSRGKSLDWIHRTVDTPAYLYRSLVNLKNTIYHKETVHTYLDDETLPDRISKWAPLDLVIGVASEDPHAPVDMTIASPFTITILHILIDEAPLSKRERKIVGLVLLGYKNDEIAQKLGISSDQVKARLHSAVRKMRAYFDLFF